MTQQLYVRMTVHWDQTDNDVYGRKHFVLKYAQSCVLRRRLKITLSYTSIGVIVINYCFHASSKSEELYRRDRGTIGIPRARDDGAGPEPERIT